MISLPEQFDEDYREAYREIKNIKKETPGKVMLVESVKNNQMFVAKMDLGTEREKQMIVEM